MKNPFSQKKIHSMGHRLEMIYMFKLVDSNFKASIVTMFNKEKENILVMQT